MSLTPEQFAARVKFLVRLARGLHVNGMASHQIEDALEFASATLGITSQFFALPTVILAEFLTPEERSTGLIRVDPGEVNLEKLVEIDDVLKDLASGEDRLGKAAARLEAIEAAPPRYGFGVVVLAHSLIAGCSARFFGGGLADVAISMALGTIPALLGLLVRVRRHFARVHVALSAVVVSFLALLMLRWLGNVSTYDVTLSSLIVLLPGLSLTLAMSEYSAQGLVAGSANLMRAGMTFVELAFGVAIGRAVAERLFAIPEGIPSSLPAWTEAVALLVAPPCFAVLFRARPREMFPILVTGVLGFVAVRFAASAVEPLIAGIVGAFVVGAVSNLWARRSDHPDTVTALPGILLLVPGSVGFEGLYNLLARQVEGGIEAVFRMALIGVSIVAGLLFASVVVPARRPF
jgi:uncharacterized membrane protein YjjP (DUF1212 family)